MASKKIKAVAKIERDAMNFFFVKMLYGYENEEPKTIYEIKDDELKNNLINLSYMALDAYPITREVGYSIIIYNPKTKGRSCDSWCDYTIPTKILVGTVPKNYFDDINYLILMISKIMKRNNLGELFVQYKDKKMTEEEFYKFQTQLSIYDV